MFGKQRLDNGGCEHPRRLPCMLPFKSFAGNDIKDDKMPIRRLSNVTANVSSR